MALPQPGDIYQPESSAELRDQMITDYRLAVLEREPTADVPDAPDGDVWILFQAVANGQMLLHANVALHDADSDFQRAEQPKLDDHRVAAGLPPVVPSPSTGKLKVEVVGGAPTSFPDALQGTLPGEVFVFVNGFQSGISDGDDVNVVTEIGDFEFAAGTPVHMDQPAAADWRHG